MKATRNVVIIAVILIALIGTIPSKGVEPILAAIQWFVALSAVVALALIHTGKQHPSTVRRYMGSDTATGRDH